MAHEISTASGRPEVAFAGETPWHGLGTKADGPMTPQEMIHLAGMTFEVGTRPIYRMGSGSYELITDHQAIVRLDTDVVMGVASNRYHPIQNHQAADIMDALVAEGQAVIEVAGALGEGERCWMLAKLPGNFEVVAGDEVKPYVLLAWGHDGKHGVAAKSTFIRVVCANTLGMALGRRWRDNADVYLRHSANFSVRIAQARKALGLVEKRVARTREAYQALSAVRISDQQAAEYFVGLFPEPVAGKEEQAEGFGRRLAAWIEKQGTLGNLYHHGAGTDIPGVAGTAWALYNAVTEYTDHVYPTLRSGEVSVTRQQSVAFGAYGEIKKHALAAALAIK